MDIGGPGHRLHPRPRSCRGRNLGRLCRRASECPAHADEADIIAACRTGSVPVDIGKNSFAQLDGSPSRFGHDLFELVDSVAPPLMIHRFGHAIGAEHE